ncbi:hypothetical protein ABZ820_05250 [Streptomyces diacarni]|uniref:hypothetical protein n=1 Tax=Streptomyces diacarni TaxID=2800381 RepID=UPI0033DA437A
MTEQNLVDQTSRLREQTLSWLCSWQSARFYVFAQQRTRPWTIPATWGSLPVEQQMHKAARAERRRVAEATTYALTAPLAEAVRAVAHDKRRRLPLTEDALPSSTGMLVSATPLCDLAAGGLTAVTWGPPMEGFGNGVHLTWWSDSGLDDLDAGESGHKWPLVPDFDLHLPYAPQLDTRLWEADVPSEAVYSHVPLRAVVAAWYALSGGETELTERRAMPAIGRDLAAHKAKKRFVHVASMDFVEMARAAIEQRAAERTERLQADHPVELGGLGETSATPARASHGVFSPELDHQLSQDERALAGLYRAAAEHWHRLESEAQQAYPGVFSHLEEVRAREHGEWPVWCWMPSIKVAAQLMNLYDVPSKRASWDGSRIAALGAWRSGGRHAVISTPIPPQRASDPPPVTLVQQMPVPGLGLVESDAPHRFVLAYLDRGQAHEAPELVFISDEGDHRRDLKEITKYTVFLTGKDMTEAVKATARYYDWAAAQNGHATPPPPGDAECAEHADVLGYFTGPLAAACASGTSPVELGGATGRKPAATWPPEPGLLPEMQLWAIPPSAHR